MNDVPLLGYSDNQAALVKFMAEPSFASVGGLVL